VASFCSGVVVPRGADRGRLAWRPARSSQNLSLLYICVKPKFYSASHNRIVDIAGRPAVTPKRRSCTGLTRRPARVTGIPRPHTSPAHLSRTPSVTDPGAARDAHRTARGPCGLTPVQRTNVTCPDSTASPTSTRR
jgi:hypothetical protein